jgi:hypothetical protein
VHQRSGNRALDKVAVLKRYGSQGAKMQNDSFVASGTSPTSDFEIENHQSIFLLRPLTPAAESWIEEFLPQDRMSFGSAVVVEHRYIADIVEGIRNDGFTVS